MLSRFKTSTSSLRSTSLSILPYLVIAILLAPSVYWIARDHSVWPWDQAWYGQVSADLWFTLMNDPRHWWSAMIHAFGEKAPGIAWIGQWFVPIGGALGSLEFGLLLSVIALQFGTLALIYKIGREFLPDEKNAALLACLMMGSAPLFIAMSHQYFTEPLQLFSVTYVYWIAAKSQSWNRVEIMAQLLLATALVFASKVSSPIYCFFPGCLAIYNAVKNVRAAPDSPSTSWKWKVLIYAGIAVSANVVIWYQKNAFAVLEFVKISSSSDLALAFGTRSNMLYKIQYWSSALQKSLALPEVLIALAIISAFGVGLRFAHSGGCRFLPSGHLSLLAAGAVAHIALVLTVFSLNINEEQRYLLPLLPAVVVTFLWCVSLVKMRLVLISLAFLFLAQWIYVDSRALGVFASGNRISHWVLPLERNSQAMTELTRIVQLTCTRESAERISVTGVELPWLNFNSLLFYAAKLRQETKVPCHNNPLGIVYPEQDTERAWERLNQLKVAYFISLEETALRDHQDLFNRVSLPILQRVQSDRRFIQLPFDSKFGVLVFRYNENAMSTH